FLQSGGTNEQLIENFITSAEYLQGRSQGTINGFLDAVYQDALNRAVDPTGRAGWTQAFQNGTTFGQIGTGILTSPEYLQDVVTEAYERFLRREPDPGGLSAYVQSLAMGARDEQVFAAIMGSNEYFGRIS